MQHPATAPPPAHPATCYQRTFHGRTDQVSQVRREIAVHLAGYVNPVWPHLLP